jgi:hypothetical protein
MSFRPGRKTVEICCGVEALLSESSKHCEETARSPRNGFLRNWLIRIARVTKIMCERWQREPGSTLNVDECT